MSVARPALVAVALAAAVALPGCNSETSRMASNAKSVQPLSPQLVSLMAEKGMSPRDPMLVRVFKEESKAEVWKKRGADGKYALLKTYDICRFSGKLGPKIKEGDKQAPEGFYSVTPAAMNPKSSYYLSFNLGFPNAYDRALGRTGRHVMMHGDCLSAGCYAMTDDQMAEIYAMARESFRGGQPAFQVQALPFRMTPQNMARRRTDKNMAFWKNLKQGSDAFEVTKLEPKVDACGKKYVFNAKSGPLSQINPNGPCPSIEVEPTIARAVSAKEKADNIVMAALAKSEPVAPEYVAQNGRLRRKLSDPIVMVAAVAPEAAGAPVAAPGAPAGTMALAAASPSAPAARTPDARPAAAAESKASAEIRTASTRAAPVSARREISADQQPVMASATPDQPGTFAKLKGWVGGLIGKSDEPPAAPAPAATPVVDTAPAEQPVKKNRSAALPKEFGAKRANPDAKVTSSYTPVE